MGGWSDLFKRMGGPQALEGPSYVTPAAERAAIEAMALARARAHSLGGTGHVSHSISACGICGSYYRGTGPCPTCATISAHTISVEVAPGATGSGAVVAPSLAPSKIKIEPAPGWKSMDDMPPDIKKNGTEILLCCDGFRMIAKWGRTIDGGYAWIDPADLEVTFEYPEKWIELPALPDSEKPPAYSEKPEEKTVEPVHHEYRPPPGFTPWLGGENPFRELISGGHSPNVECVLRNGSTLLVTAERLRWDHNGSLGDIMAFRFVPASK